MLENIPTHIIMGFLGSGKTTAILNLFTQKPAQERWAVLVNEMGHIGIDGEIYSSQGIYVEEIPGGCMCCIQGIPMRIAINRLLRATRPTRLLIESSGIGHPSGLIKALSTNEFSSVLNIKATIALLDPEKLLDPRTRGNDLFQDQLACADVLVANKTDLASEAALRAFIELEKQFKTNKPVIARTTYSQLDIGWLKLPRGTPRDIEHWVGAPAVNNSSRLWRSASWRFPETTLFSRSCLEQLTTKNKFLRLKGFIQTKSGWFLINAEAGRVAFTRTVSRRENQLTAIAPELDEQGLESRFEDCVLRH